MKRFMIFAAIVFIMAMLTINMRFIAPAGAQEEQVDVYESNQLVKSVVFVVGHEQYYVDNETPGVKMDAKPFIEAGRTFVPIRYLSNALGVGDKHIGWESPKVMLNEPGLPVVEMAVGSKEIRSNGQARAMDTAPLLKIGRTYLPARFVAEALGYNVAWDVENKVVLCWPKGTEKPDVNNIVSYVKGQPVEQPPVETPTVPEGSTKELFDKAEPLDGEPFSFSGWKFDSGIQKSLQNKWDLSGYESVIQEATVSDLKPNGIDLGGLIVHDLKVTKDGVTVTATSPSRKSPFFYLVENGNTVRYCAGGGYMGQETGTLTEDVNYIGRSPNNPLPTPDLTKATHILFEYGGKLLNVVNPAYQGGN